MFYRDICHIEMLVLAVHVWQLSSKLELQFVIVRARATPWKTCSLYER